MLRKKNDDHSYVEKVNMLRAAVHKTPKLLWPGQRSKGTAEVAHNPADALRL